MRSWKSLRWLTGIVLLLTTTGFTQEEANIDPETIIEQIVTVDTRQRENISDIVFDAEYVEGEMDTGNSSQDDVRFVKKVYLKYQSDTVWFYEEYLEYYEKGVLQSEEKRNKKATENIEKKKKRKVCNISNSMLSPFGKHRMEYEINYAGITPEPIGDYVCHHFKVRALVDKPGYVIGDYYFEAETFHLVRVDFSPVKLTGNVMFRMNEMNMSIQYGPTTERYWLPRQLDIRGKGKVAFLLGVKFSGTEYYRNPRINTNLSNELFEENNGF